MVEIEDLFQNQHLPSQIAPRNEYYNSYSFAFHLYFKVSAIYWNLVWTGSVQNVEQPQGLLASPELKELLTPVGQDLCSTPRVSALSSYPKLTKNLDPETTPFPFLTISSPESHVGPEARIALQQIQSEFRCVQAFHLPEP